MAIAIEPMREEDVEAIARLRLEAFFKGTARTFAEDAAGLRELVSSDSFECGLVARLDDKAVGSVLLVRDELESAHRLTPWLAGLVVVRKYRRSGIGTMLVQAIETYAVSTGVSELYLYTWDVRDFYARLGWRPVETFVQHGEKMMLMARRPS